MTSCEYPYCLKESGHKTAHTLECKHENSISAYDGSCHVILGWWYCTDCKTMWKTKEKERQS